MVMDRPFTTASPVIASYNYLDLASGEGIASYYLTNSKDTDGEKFQLSQTRKMTASDNGKITAPVSGGNSGVYNYETSIFNLPRTCKGKATLTGFADYVSGSGILLSARMYVKNGEVIAGSLGDVTWTSSGEVSHGETVYRLVKTLAIDGYVNKLDHECKIYSGSQTAYNKYVFFYEDIETADSAIMTTSSNTYVTLTAVNPNITKKVVRVELWSYTTGGNQTYFKNLNAYVDTVTNTPTAISPLVTTPTSSSDTGIHIEMPLTETNISKGKQLQCKITLAGGVGFWVQDPTAEFITDKGTLQLNIPFDIDL